MTGIAGSTRPPASFRLFVAVDIPDDVRELVRRGVQPIRERYPDGRWVPRENQHVTVKFLGAVPPDSVAPAIETIGEVAVRLAPFPTRARELGAFPATRRARVLWVGLEDPAARLAALAAALDAGLARTVAPETRPFRPHVTVARFDPPVSLEGDLPPIAIEAPPFEVEEITLFRSHLGRPGARYERLATFPLAG